MKSVVRIVAAAASLALVGTGVAQAQISPSPTASGASATSASSSTARTDVYHVYFGKAAAGKAAQMLEFLKTQDPKAPMPGHLLILRHQEGDAWDYVAIEHLGTNATVDATPFQVPAGMRDVTEWHNDTFVNGPPWDEFSRAMGLGSDAAKSAGSVYVVSVHRAVPGRRDDLEKFLGQAPDRSVDTSAGNVLMQHLDGGPWNFLALSRYNSWQDFAKNEMNTVAQAMKSTDAGWFRLRENSAYHTDTVACRVAP